MDITKVSEAARLMREAQSILGTGPLDFYLSEMAASYNLLMQRFAPFRVGSRVELRVDPNITPDTAPGWMHSKHYLIKGAKGVVREASCGSGGFRFAVEFDNETWIDLKGKKRPPTNKSLFYFGENSLVAQR